MIEVEVEVVCVGGTASSPSARATEVQMSRLTVLAKRINDLEYYESSYLRLRKGHRREVEVHPQPTGGRA